MVTIELTTYANEEGGMAAQLVLRMPDVTDYCRDYKREYLKADSSQRQELKAMAAGLLAINRPARVICNLQSSHIRAAVNQEWRKIWRENGWKNQKGRLVRDWELWREIAGIVEEKGLLLMTGGK